MRFFLLILFIVSFQPIFGQSTDAIWQEVNNRSTDVFEYEDRIMIPKSYRTLELDFEQLQRTLQSAPLEFTGTKSSVLISLPILPNGFETFEVYESPVMSPVLSAKFPKIKSYKARGVHNRLLSARFDCSPEGFHGSIFTGNGKIYIDPEEMTTQYICYATKDMDIVGETLPLACGYNADLVESTNTSIDDLSSVSSYSASSAVLPLRVYRLALACTGEYAVAKGGTVNSVVASFNTALNRVNQIFELEAGVRVELIDNNDDLIFLDGDTDPYFNPTLGTGLLGQNAGAFSGAGVTIDQYDLGHVFTIGCSDVGGVVSGQTCDPNGKMRGVTCHYTSNIEAIAVDVMSHEIAHQFSCGHSWSNCTGSEQQLSAGNAFEPGSGSTIMSYAGACQDQNIAFNSDDYYNIGSVEDFIFFSREGSGACGVEHATSNNEPSVDIELENGFFIPISTPFEIEAVGSDPDGDVITYCWEQYDLGPVSPVGSPILNAPLFRSFRPSENPSRTFPRLPLILSNNNDPAELLPSYSRDMTFRCTVRDNNPEVGATVWDEVRFKSSAAAGPFRVQYPSALDVEMEVGDYVEIRWDVANTDSSPVNCQKVNIYLSTNGGNAFPILLAENIANDGSEFVLIPDNVTNTARIKVKAADNIFFDVSNSNFKIVPPSTPGYSWAVSPSSQQVCLPNTTSIALETGSLLEYDSMITFEVIEGLPSGAIMNFSANPTTPAEGSVLDIDLNAVTEEGMYEILVRAIAPSTDTVYRTIVLDVVSNDFSALAIESPSAGESGVTTLPTFVWTTVADANSYIIEIATSPIFGDSIIDSAEGITGGQYSPSITFDESTPYYWRVFPINECGKGTPLLTNSFHTVSFTCATDDSVDTPVNITGSGAPTVESKINVFANGIINDINIPILQGNHEWFSDLKATLISPAGTEVVLFSGKCTNYNGNFNFGIDDQAPVGFQCPPTSGSYKPQQSLSAFIGESTAGLWTLRMEDSQGGSGGQLKDWQLEFCANVSTTPPVLVNNIEMTVNPNDGRDLANEFLLTEDSNNEEWELIYTLVDTPKKGTITLDDVALEVGSEFTQSNIHWGLLRYTHTGENVLDTDGFRFTVRDNEGGWIGTPKFSILIDPDAIVNTHQVVQEERIRIYPNPATDLVSIEFDGIPATSTLISLVDVKGRLLSQKTHLLDANLVELEVANLPSGVYFLKFQMENTVSYQKLIVD